MKIIDGLKESEAIKFGEGYIVQLPWGEKHKVNGILTKLTQVYVKPNELNSIKKVIKIYPKITHYLDSNNEIKSLEFFKDIDSQFYNIEAEEFQYPDIDTEYKCKKQKELLKPVYSETKEIEEDIEIKIIGEQIPTGSDFIITPYSLGQSSFNSNNGIFKIPCLNDITIDEFFKLKEKYKLDNFKLEPNSKSNPNSNFNIKYAQINEKYIFININPQEEDYISNKSRIFSSLDEAKDYENQVRQFTRNYVLLYLKEHQKVDDIERSELVKDLAYLEKEIRELDVKIKSASTKQHCLKLIEKLKNSLIPNDK